MGCVLGVYTLFKKGDMMRENDIRAVVEILREIEEYCNSRNIERIQV